MNNQTTPDDHTEEDTYNKLKGICPKCNNKGLIDRPMAGFAFRSNCDCDWGRFYPHTPPHLIKSKESPGQKNNKGV